MMVLVAPLGSAVRQNVDLGKQFQRPDGGHDNDENIGVTQTW